MAFCTKFEYEFKNYNSYQSLQSTQNIATILQEQQVPSTTRVK